MKETTAALIIDTNEKLSYVSLWNILALFSFSILGIRLIWRQPEFILRDKHKQYFRVSWQKISYKQHSLEEWQRICWEICHTTIIGFSNTTDILQLFSIYNSTYLNQFNREYSSAEKKIWLENFF